MGTRLSAAWLPFVLVAAATSSCGGTDNGLPDTGRRRDGATDGRVGDGAVVTPDSGPGPCLDTDGDGIADGLESPADDDRDSTPNWMDLDSDGDGFTDADESIGNYPGFMSTRTPLTCGQSADDCDMDATPNFRDLDSDNDGLTDAEESTAHTNPCGTDTDGDGIDDLTERAAMSSPTDPMSRPPAGSLYVTLPYHPPGEMGDHPRREFTFATRLRAADIFFVVDTTGSMGGTITTIQNTLMSQIIPGIRTALGAGADVRYGMSAHGDFQEGGINYTGSFQVFQRLDPNPALSQSATSMLRADNGGDGPESMVPAMHSAISGHGTPNYRGTATRPVNPVTDCGMTPDDPETFGWACFRTGRVPIIVLFSDAQWHNGPGMGNFYGSTPSAGTYAQLSAEMMRRGAYFVGIDVTGMNTFPNSTYQNSLRLAMDTGTLDAAGRPLAFYGTQMTVGTQVVDAITQIAGSSRQDITTRTDPDRMETRIATPNTTATFIRAVTPVRGIPDAPTGYMRHDMTTFYSVLPSTSVVFSVDFYNDFQEGGTTAQIYRATIVVLGRARSEVDRREVFMIVPARGGQPPG